MASIYVTLNDQFSSSQAQALYEEVYGPEPLVDVLPPGSRRRSGMSCAPIAAPSA